MRQEKTLMKTRTSLFGHPVKSFIFPLLLLAVFLSSVIFNLFGPMQGTTYAAVEDERLQKDRTILFALRACISNNKDYWKDEVGGDAVSKTNMSGIINSDLDGALGKIEVPVGYEIDGDNGNAKCNGISLTRALNFIDRTPNWFFGQIYDLENPENDGDNKVYKRKSNIKITDNINSLLNQKDAAIGKAERQRRLAKAFWLCNEEVPEGQNPSRTDNVIGGKRYQLKEGKKSDSEISVGLDLETTNGKYECGTLLKWGDPAFMAEALAANPPSAGGNGGDSGDGLTGSTDSCDVKINSPISWIVCPIVDGINKAVVALDKEITSLLTVGTDRIFCTEVGGDCSQKEVDTGKRYYTAWNSLRTIALGLIVIAALVVIIASAFGYEILDAYTIRKVLPRLLISIVFITLSWNIMEFFIVLTNDVGNGLRALIYAPFEGMGDVTLSGGTQIIGLLSAGVMGVFLGAVGLLSLGLTALLAVLIAFGVLIVRELIIVMLVIIAPIGIACLVLPNTRKGWQLWQNSMTAMLVVFPIITAIIATGRVFAMTAFAGGEASNIEEIIAFIAYFLPYFLIPFAFRAAGGLMATLAGITNDRSRGMFDRLKKVRADNTAKNINAMKSGTRFTGSMPGTRTAAGAFNRATVGASTGVRGRFGFGARGKEAIAQQRAIAGMELMKDPRWAAIKDDDGALRAATYSNASAAYEGVRQHYFKEFTASGMDANKAAAEAADMARHSVAAVQTSVGFGRPQAAAATQAMIDTGTSFSDIQDVAQTIARSSAGNESMAANLAGYANSKTKSVGRHDLAPGFGKLNDLAQEEMKALGTGGGPDASKYAEAMEEAWASGSLYQHANDKPQNLQAAIKHFQGEWASGDHKRMEKAAIFHEELKAMLPNTHGKARDDISKAIQANGDQINRFLSSSALDDKGEAIVREVPITDRNGRPTGGFRQETMSVRQVLNRDQRIREYRQPDPNTMQ